MRTVLWSEDALDDLDAAIAFIARSNPQAATDLVDRIDAAATALGEHAIGRHGRVAGTYEKPVTRTRYLIAYETTDAAVFILRVIHGARHWPDEAWPD